MGAGVRFSGMSGDGGAISDPDGTEYRLKRYFQRVITVEHSKRAVLFQDLLAPIIETVRVTHNDLLHLYAIGDRNAASLLFHRCPQFPPDFLSRCVDTKSVSAIITALVIDPPLHSQHELVDAIHRELETSFDFSFRIRFLLSALRYARTNQIAVPSELWKKMFAPLVSIIKADHDPSMTYNRYCFRLAADLAEAAFGVEIDDVTRTPHAEILAELATISRLSTRPHKRAIQLARWKRWWRAIDVKNRWAEVQLTPVVATPELVAVCEAFSRRVCETSAQPSYSIVEVFGMLRLERWWSPASHRFINPGMKQMAKTLMLVRHRIAAQDLLPALPMEMWELLMSMVPSESFY